MAKDALGHGSNSGGGSGDANKKLGDRLERMGFFGKVQIASQAADSMKVGSKLAGGMDVNAAAKIASAAADAHAARELASGTPKSDAAPTHPAMGGWEGSMMHNSAGGGGGNGRHGYNPDSVNKAIGNASRYQGKVGGREASAIHRLLKGR